MRIQTQLGQADAATRTLKLLTARLVEIDEAPTPATVALGRPPLPVREAGHSGVV
jgi:hypothetical protein